MARWSSLGLLLALCSAEAVADWSAVAGANEIYAAFADAASIHRKGTMARMSGLYDFKQQDFTPEGKAMFSTVVLREYDCERRRVRLLSAIDFSGPMGAGEPVSTVAATGRWEAVVEGALDEAYWNVACGSK